MQVKKFKKGLNCMSYEVVFDGRDNVLFSNGGPFESAIHCRETKMDLYLNITSACLVGSCGQSGQVNERIICTANFEEGIRILRSSGNAADFVTKTARVEFYKNTDVLNGVSFYETENIGLIIGVYIPHDTFDYVAKNIMHDGLLRGFTVLLNMVCFYNFEDSEMKFLHIINPTSPNEHYYNNYNGYTGENIGVFDWLSIKFEEKTFVAKEETPAVESILQKQLQDNTNKYAEVSSNISAILENNNKLTSIAIKLLVAIFVLLVLNFLFK
ncbi:hypothetical protein [Deefgea piscis]|uniref:hypothetical protein n=1 Tax=Deefgea piscis TaxID=2739061 RepID=UPI001C826605|nr:hypothetical protein [Deefgea piscis]QZA82576.1 hypothetical protein K4H25_08080 [Deefgea piscis]